MPKVSVIIPVYNGEKYVVECLESVLAQTYSNFEVIVVDDGSQDDTPAIVREYETKYPDKVRLIQKENGGPGSARNVGIRASKGKYIAVNDADDLWLPEKLRKQVQFFERLPPQVGLVYSDCRRFDNDGVWTFNKYRSKFVSGWIYEDLVVLNVIPNNSVMIRREVFAGCGVFDESLDIIEDHDMWLRIAMKFQVWFIDEVLVLYREHPLGRSKKEEEKTLRRALAVMKKHLRLTSGNIQLQNAVRKGYAERLYDLGFFLLRQGRMRPARDIFTEALNIRLGLKLFSLKLMTFLPYKFLLFCNDMFRRFSRPADTPKNKNGLDGLCAQ